MTDVLSRRERKKDETRHRIFHAAISLFREKGFEQTTVDDITERADVAKGTFFNYFRRKDAVLAYLTESRLLAIEENASTFLSTDRPVTEKLIDLYTVGASAYEEDPELARYVLIELMSRVFVPSEESMRRWHELSMSIIRQGQERGELQRDADPERVEGVLSCVYHGTLYQWVCCVPHVFPLLPELRARLTLALEGIAS
jgi:TetR/AcrR family transcriptional regulator, cholesterol catabolism regulator